MKTHRFELGRYFQGERDLDETGNIYIDWPSIHRQAGVDHIRWLKHQDKTECQIVLEKRPNDYHTYVIAEIYSEKLATLYSLMWAK